MSTHVKFSGGLFFPMASVTAHRVVEDAQRETADEGVQLIRQALGPVLRNPTGYYESQITADLSTGDPAVTDNKVVYGPWLEGTSSRNSSTRFKGYATFRRTTRAIQQVADEKADNAAREIARRWS